MTLFVAYRMRKFDFRTTVLCFKVGDGSALILHESHHDCTRTPLLLFTVVAIQPIRTGDEVYIDYLSASACCDEDHDADADSSDEQNHMHEEDVNAMDEDDHDAVDDDDNEEYEEEPTRRDLLRKYYLFECTCVKCNEECSAR